MKDIVRRSRKRRRSLGSLLDVRPCARAKLAAPSLPRWSEIARTPAPIHHLLLPRQQSPASFHLFPQLPADMRLLIWESFFLTPRYHYFYHHLDDGGDGDEVEGQKRREQPYGPPSCLRYRCVSSLTGDESAETYHRAIDTSISYEARQVAFRLRPEIELLPRRRGKVNFRVDVFVARYQTQSGIVPPFRLTLLELPCSSRIRNAALRADSRRPSFFVMGAELTECKMSFFERRATRAGLAALRRVEMVVGCEAAGRGGKGRKGRKGRGGREKRSACRRFGPRSECRAKWAALAARRELCFHLDVSMMSCGRLL